MNHNLTPNQLEVLNWLINEIKVGNIGETFRVLKKAQVWSGSFYGDNPGRGSLVAGNRRLTIKSDLGKVEAPESLNFGVLNALVAGEFLVLVENLYSVTRRVYEIENSDVLEPESSDVHAYMMMVSELIKDKFDRVEFAELCFSLDVNPNWDLDNEKEWPHQLPRYLYRHNRLKDLSLVLHKYRPNVSWPELPEI